MTRSFRALVLLLILCVPFAGQARARAVHGAISVVDDHHTALTLAAPPMRIIALAPNVVEILFALGLGPEVVGVSSYSTYPPQAAKLPVVLTLSGANYEKIVALKPDLIISAAIVPRTTVLKLRSLHLPVLVTDPHDLAGILHDLTLVGTASGVPRRAAALVRRLQARISAVKTALAHVTTHPTVFYELDPQYFYTAGRGSFVDSLIQLAGGVNIAGTVHNAYPQLSSEKIIAADPQYIVLGDANYGASAAKVAARPGWSEISAVKNHRVYPFNDDLASRPGPRIVDGLEKLAHLLHPEAFRSAAA